MAEMVKRRRAVNPGKRKMSPLQKLFFGSKRQRAAVARKKNGGKKTYSYRVTKKRLKKATGTVGKKFSKQTFKRYVSETPSKRRRKNVGSILTVLPVGLTGNPGSVRKTKKRAKKHLTSQAYEKYKAAWTSKRNKKGASMATKRRKRNRAVSRKRVHRRKRNYGTQIGRSWSTYKGRRKRNPGVVVRYRTRNKARRVKRYHRNPGMLTGTVGRVLGVVAGVGATKLLTSFLPNQLQTGILGYLATGAVAIMQGKLAGKMSKSSSFGNDMTIGGLAYLAAKILNDFIPSVGSYTGISGGRGMGLIGGSSFYTPQVNQNGSMGSFLVPSAVMGAIPAATANAGMGRLRRTGRLM